MEQRADWMTFLSAFADECKNMGRLLEARKITTQRMMDVAGEYFIRAHDYDEPRLHEAMREVWGHIQVLMNKLAAEVSGENKLTKDELFRKHMLEMFNNTWKVNEERIPAETRAYFRLHYERECAVIWFH